MVPACAAAALNRFAAAGSLGDFAPLIATPPPRALTRGRTFIPQPPSLGAFNADGGFRAWLGVRSASSGQLGDVRDRKDRRACEDPVG